MKDRTSLLKEIDEISFTLNDLTLYLDTHQDCPEAISYFNAMAPRRAALLKEYAAAFGPLTIDCIQQNGGLTDRFAWTDGPAPWEGGTL